jgi:hypothetical protein
MRTLAVFLLFASLALAQAPNQSGQKPKKPKQPAKSEAELKWAKGIAVDFLGMLKSREYKPATLLLTDNLNKALGDGVNTADSYLNNKFSQLSSLAWTFKVEEMSPDGNEAAFKGTLTGEYGQDDVESDLVIRVTKEKEGGTWRISLLSLGEFKKKGKKAQPK